MASSILTCENSEKGCRYVFQTEAEAKLHLDKCFYEEAICVMCSDKVIRKNLFEHVDKQCKHRIVPCGLCLEEVQYFKLEDHRKNCPKRQVQCPHCLFEGLAENFDSHLQDCEYMLRKCSMSDFGCKFVDIKENLSQHHRNFDLHFELLCGHFRKQLGEFKTRFEECNSGLERVTNELDAVRGHFRSFDKVVDYVRDQMNDVINNVSRIDENLSKQEDDWSGLTEIVSGQQNDLNGLSKAHNELLTKISKNENSIKVLIDNFEKCNDENKTQREIEKAKLESLESKNSNLEERINLQAEQIKFLKETIENDKLLMEKERNRISQITLEHEYTKKVLENQINAIKEFLPLNDTELPDLDFSFSLYSGCRGMPAGKTMEDLKFFLFKSPLAPSEAIVVETKIRPTESTEMGRVILEGKPFQCFIDCTGLMDDQKVGLHLRQIEGDEVALLEFGHDFQAIMCVLDPDTGKEIVFYHILDGHPDESGNGVTFRPFSINLDLFPDRSSMVQTGNLLAAFLIYRKLEDKQASEQGEEVTDQD